MKAQRWSREYFTYLEQRQSTSKGNIVTNERELEIDNDSEKEREKRERERERKKGA